MGTTACAAVTDAHDLELAAALGSADPIDRLVEARVDVAVDLTRPDAVMDNVRFCVDQGIPVVVGTSGISEQLLGEIRGWLAQSPAAAVLVVPNFAIGAVLMMRFAAQAARFFESVEILELHHPGKADAPSGTARRTAEVVARERRAAGLGPMPDATTDAAAGSRGAAIDGIPVHAVRLRGLVAHQEVLLGSAGETLTIRHDSVDRSSFMPGLLLAIREAPGRPGLTLGLDPLLNLP